MRYSQLKDEKFKESKKIKKKTITTEIDAAHKSHTSEKTNCKIAPHHRKQKSHHKSQNSVRQQYYTSPQPQNLNASKQYSYHDKNINKHKNNRRSGYNINQYYEGKKMNEISMEINDPQEENQPSPNQYLKSPILKKMKLLSSQGDIQYKGQTVRKNRLESEKSSKISRKGEMTSESETKKHSKFASKKKKKDNKDLKKQKSKIKKQKNSQHTKSYDLLEETYHFCMDENQFQPELVNMEQIHQEIQEESKNAFQYILSNQIIKERGQCMKIIGRICSSMNLKREIFAITISYVDSFIDSETAPESLKAVAITALTMALKINHAETIGGVQLASLSSIHSMTSTKALSFSTDAKSLEKKKKTIEDNGYNKFNLNRPKFPNLLNTILSHEQIYSNYDRVLCKQQIIDMQMQMMVKLNFKLSIKTYANWIDILTLLWDDYLVKKDTKRFLSFRKKQSIKNFSYLCQLVQISYYFPYGYFYSKVILVLSVMYILTRISVDFPLDREQKGFEIFKSSLLRSSNIIFVDKKNINQLFGSFLNFFRLDLGDIVNCCQYVAHYLDFKMLRVLPLQYLTLEQYLGVYQYNPELFRFFQLKFETQLIKN